VHVGEDTTAFLGSVRLPISRIGIGPWAIGGGWGPQPETTSLQALHCALEMGCGLIDTAALYGNGRAERLIAQAFKQHGQRVTTLTKIFSAKLPLGSGTGHTHDRDLSS
jgi:aryl-alcohol dehydrogenase-like predicted oxidoreductase